MSFKTLEKLVEAIAVDSDSILASRHKKISYRSKNKPKNIPLASLKLAVALELKAEGYTRIEFDKVVEFNGLKVKVHVLGEDELGARLAVLCINRLEKFNPTDLADTVEVVQRAMGEEGDVAIAISIGLLEEAKDIFGITKHVFLVDLEYRVWSHSCDSAYTSMIKYAILRQHQSALSEEKDENLNVNLKDKPKDTGLPYIA